MTKKYLLKNWKKLLFLGAAVSTVFVAISCEKTVDTNNELKEIARNIVVQYNQKENEKTENAHTKKLQFSNYSDDNYEIVDVKIVSRNQKDQKIKIGFKVKNKKTFLTSDEIFIDISGFMKEDAKKSYEPIEQPNMEKPPSDKKQKLIDIDHKNQLKIKNVYNLKIGHWNVLNYGASSSKQTLKREEYKAAAISEIISKSNLDLVGLTEINYERADRVKLIVDKLNELEKGKHVWKYVFQSAEDKNPKSNKSTAEQIAIVYRTEVFNPVNFDENLEGSSFKQTWKSIVDPEQSIGYVRPLYGHKFEHSNSKKTFTFVFGHFDSPGVKKNSSEKNVTNFEYEGKNYSVNKDSASESQKYDVSQQGSQEVGEAINLAKALEYFNRIDGDSTIVFGGDTNIKYGNKSLFKTSLDLGYKLLYDDIFVPNSDKYATSLKTKFAENNSYSQPYDRFLFKESNGVDVIDETEDPELKFKVDIVNAFNNGLLDLQKYKDLWYNKAKDREYTQTDYIKGISDHALVFVNIKITA